VDGDDRQHHPGSGGWVGRPAAGRQPKNLLLAVGCAATIAQTGSPVTQQAIAYLAFAPIGTGSRA
jgi:hypothetical protein